MAVQFLEDPNTYSPIQIDRPVRVGTSLPSHARVGEIYFLVNQAANKLYACFALNTWVELAASAESGTSVFAELPSGTVNGSNATFTLAQTPKTGTLQLFLNGRFLVGGTDNTLAAAILTMDLS